MIFVQRHADAVQKTEIRAESAKKGYNEVNIHLNTEMSNHLRSRIIMCRNVECKTKINLRPKKKTVDASAIIMVRNIMKVTRTRRYITYNCLLCVIRLFALYVRQVIFYLCVLLCESFPLSLYLSGFLAQ